MSESTLSSEMPPWLTSRETVRAYVEELETMHRNGDHRVSEILERNLEEASASADQFAVAMINRLRAYPLRDEGLLVRSLQVAGEAANLLGSLGEFGEQIIALRYCASCYVHMSDPASCFQVLDQAIDIAEANGLLRQKIETQMGRALSSLEMNIDEGCLDRLMELHRQYKDILPSERQVRLVNNIASALCSVGRFEEALRYAKEGLNRVGDGGTVTHRAFLLNNLATAMSESSPFEEVRTVARQSQELFRIAGKLIYIPTPMQEVGAALMKLGRWEHARICLEEAKGLALSTPGTPGLKQTCALLGETYENLGDCVSALGEFKTVARLLEEFSRHDISRVEQLAQYRHEAEWAKREAELLKQVNQGLQAAKEAAEATTRAKTDFLSNMSHEIRTPIAGVLGIADLLLHSDLDPEVRNYVLTIQSSGETLLTVINDILDLSKIEAGKLEIERNPFNLVQVVEDTCMLLDTNAKSKGLRLTFQAEKAVPTTLIGDSARIRQILYNIIGNAIKFTEIGAIEVRLRSAAIAEHSVNVKVSVSDTGIGIAASRLPMIFDSFTQEDSSTSRRFGGTGLGLSISKRLVELMGGSIYAESTAGIGSTFHFELEMKVAEEKPRGIPDRPSLTASDNSNPLPLTGLSILLADDNRVNQMVTMRLMTRLGAKVDCANDGQLALEMVEGNPYDLVLMDCQMPVIDGFEATRRIRKMGNCAHIPVVAITANAMQGDREACLAAGMNGYVTKPVDSAQLLAAILAALESR